MQWLTYLLPSAPGDPITGGTLTEAVTWNIAFGLPDGALLCVGFGSAHGYLHRRDAQGAPATRKLPDGYTWYGMAFGNGRLVLLAGGNGTTPPFFTFTTDNFGGRWDGPFPVHNPNGDSLGHQWVPGSIGWNGSTFLIASADNWTATSASGQSWTSGPTYADITRVYPNAWDGGYWYVYDSYQYHLKRGTDGLHWTSMPDTPGMTIAKIGGGGGILYNGYQADLHRSLDHAGSWEHLGQVQVGPIGSYTSNTDLAVDPRNPTRALAMLDWNLAPGPTHHPRLTLWEGTAKTDLPTIPAIEGAADGPASPAGWANQHSPIAFFNGRPALVMAGALYVYALTGFWTDFIGCEER